MKKIFFSKTTSPRRREASPVGGEGRPSAGERCKVTFSNYAEELDTYLINSTILHSASLGIYLRQTSASTGQSGLRVKLKIVSAFPPQGAGRLGRGGGKWFGFQETTSCEWRRERGKLPKQKKISIKMKNWRRSWQRFPSDCESSWTGWRKDFLASGRARLTIITGLQSFALFWCRFRFLHNFLLIGEAKKALKKLG